MADFKTVMSEVWRVEHNNNPRLALHRNEKEKTYTFFGIYPYTKLPSSYTIDDFIELIKSDAISIMDASEKLAKNEELYNEVLDWYRINFYDKLGINYIDSTKKASELMVFFVNVGKSKYRVRLAVKFIQSIIGATVDGIAGVETLNKLNAFDDDKFDKLFDEFEIKFYRGLVARNRRLKWALKGWMNRARLV